MSGKGQQLALIMKFAHNFKEALQREGFPAYWVESAIPYSQLKKCIKKVEGELKSVGLDSETLAHLVPLSPGTEIQQVCHRSGDAPVAFEYNFAEELNNFRPKLTLYVQLEDGVAIDASLSYDTRKYLELVARQRHLLPSFMKQADGTLRGNGQRISAQQHSISWDIADLVTQRIEVPLTFDAEFFGLLRGDVSILDALQVEEQKALTDEIKTIGKEVAKVAGPSKSDLDRWRELFDVYLQAGVFFSTNEFDHGSRNSTNALIQLEWFKAEVTKRGLAKSFKLSASRDVFEQFIRINMTLLCNLKFQEINQLAISKILKKFDKRTSLGARDTFSRLIQCDPIMSETMAKAVCAEVSNEIIRIVPQIDDYLCPVCFSISYKPVRLTCNHVFCIRCMIQMQRDNAKYCPLCRNDVIMDADSANLDISLMNFLQKYFPKETKAKQKENEIAAGVDLYGEDFANAKCIVM